jgi:hypothetical protein
MTERLMPLEKIRGISDPIERARVAEEQRLAAIALAGDYAQIRAEAAAELRAQGMSYGQIGQAFGMTRERARQLAAKGADKE